tara:strand:+ start:192 stop:437 length:246 start_codon:yes stop_codon:yes gene_type:complete
MKLSKQQLKRIIREEKRRLQESSDIYPRPQHPMIANANTEARNRRIDIIADALCNMTGESPDLCDRVAEEIVAQLESEGLC